MKEETKEEYLARIRKEKAEDPEEEQAVEEENVESRKPGLKDRLKRLILFILFLGFIYMIFQVFGMLKSN